MGCHYSVTGKIPVDPANPKLRTAVEDTFSDWPYLDCGLSDDRTEFGVYIGDSMSYSTACGIDEDLIKFAQQFATAPAVLRTECDGESEKLFVGPAGYDFLQAVIDDTDSEIAALQERRRRLVEEKARNVPLGA